MARNKFYLAFGEEAARGTAEVTNVSHIPIDEPVLPTFTPTDEDRNEIRGECSILGMQEMRRESVGWTYSYSMPVYSESGGISGGVGTLLKHFFGTTTSVQNSSTGQYYHLSYPVDDPFSSTTGRIGAKGLTFIPNQTIGSSDFYNPYTGGRINQITITQEVNQTCKIGFECFGQTIGAETTALSSPTYAPQNLRLNYNTLKVYTGTVARSGAAPNFTTFDLASATQVFPYSTTITLSNGFSPNQRLEGLNYANKTKFANKWTATVDLNFDFDDPSSGFSAGDEWRASIGSTISNRNWLFKWDTGVAAGTGDNHNWILDFPSMNLTSGNNPERSRETDSTISLNYTGNNAVGVTDYMVSSVLSNTASAV